MKIDWFKKNKVISALVAAIVVLTYFAFTPKVITKIEEKIIFKDNPKDVVMSRNWLVEDLDKLKFQRIKVKEDMVKVWRYKEVNNTFVFTAIFEHKDELKYNKAAYEKYTADKKNDTSLLKVK